MCACMCMCTCVCTLCMLYLCKRKHTGSIVRCVSSYWAWARCYWMKWAVLQCICRASWNTVIVGEVSLPYPHGSGSFNFSAPISRSFSESEFETLWPHTSSKHSSESLFFNPLSELRILSQLCTWLSECTYTHTVPLMQLTCLDRKRQCL